MYGTQILQIKLFGQDKNDRVMSVSATRMYLSVHMFLFYFKDIQ